MTHRVSEGHDNINSLTMSILFYGFFMLFIRYSVCVINIVAYERLLNKKLEIMILKLYNHTTKYNQSIQKSNEVQR